MKLFAFSLFLSFLGMEAIGQCPQKIDVSPNVKKQSFEVRISSQGPFEGSVVLVDGTEQKNLRTFSGHGSQTLSFNDLPRYSLYKVIVDFTNEERFLCRKKVKIVDLTASK